MPAAANPLRRSRLLTPRANPVGGIGRYVSAPTPIARARTKLSATTTHDRAAFATHSSRDIVRPRRDDMMDIYSELEWRGMLSESTEGVREALLAAPPTGYIGVGPTAPRLPLRAPLTVMGLARLQRFGHNPIAIVGGGTGMIGDPSGKSQERKLLSADQLDENVAGIRRQLEKFL